MRFLTLFLLVFFLSANAYASEKESVYSHIIRTGILRCAYGIYDPSFIKDNNSGKMSGIFYDLTNEIGKRLGLEIQWVEEVGYGTIAEGFRTGRYDAFCATVYPTPDRVKSAMFSIPIYYNLVGVFVRKDDTRFDQDYMTLNNPAYTLAVKDGDITHSIATSRFPKAKQISVPDLALTEQQLLEVSLSKADATFNDVYLLHRYNDANPDKPLKNVAGKKPLKYFPNTYMLPPEEPQLKHMFDVTLSELISEGIVEDILRKYQKPGMVNLPPSKPYEVR